MPSFEILLAFSAAALLMNISPGPSNLYVMARSVAQGFRGGVVAAAGLAAGSLMHVLAAVLGLSTLFRHSPVLYTTVKLAGAAYLIYLGVTCWQGTTADTGRPLRMSGRKPLFSVFRESLLVELGNPKTALFFIAFLPQFVVPETGPVSLQLLVLGSIVTLSALPCDLLVAALSSKVSAWFAGQSRVQRLQERISGAILFGLGSFILAGEVDRFRG